ncbi:unnamed protein product [Moneuplotes crassus]|uniref:Uncharacterized protein n=1 Tax=Euplotes crassus TaxID=5936 RepID=A0AAD1XEH2_EUPCR|nr:unnamed protein product [Moneuplotes crassus]
MSDKPPRPNRINKFKNLVSKIKQKELEQKGIIAPSIEISSKNKKILQETIDLLQGDYFSSNDSCEYNSHGSITRKCLLSELHSEKKSRREKKALRRRKNTYDFFEDDKIDRKLRKQLNIFKVKRSIRIISDAMLKFGLKKKERKQVQLRIFARDHMKSILTIQRAFMNFINKRKDKARYHIRFYYKKLFIQTLITDLKHVEVEFANKREEERQRREEELERERQEEPESFQNHSIVDNNDSNWSENHSPSFEFIALLDTESESETNLSVVKEEEKKSVKEESKLEVTTSSNEVVDDKMFGHIKGNLNSNADPNYLKGSEVSPYNFDPKALSMVNKEVKILKLHHDSKKSTYIFKEEDETINIPRFRGLTMKQVEQKFSCVGLDLLKNQRIEEEEIPQNEEPYLDQLKYHKQNLTPAQKVSKEYKMQNSQK